jgi:hypothetical protein
MPAVPKDTTPTTEAEPMPDMDIVLGDRGKVREVYKLAHADGFC